MIPKTIHYCWFGGKKLPGLAKDCIQSWRKFFPDYEIKRWDETNFDININDYVKEAYNAKRYAFVSDYARFWILYNYGGVYFDTDVKVINPMDDILCHGAYMGFESIEGQEPLFVNPGLGMAAEKGNKFLENMLSLYDSMHFVDKNGVPCLKSIVMYTSERLIEEGLKNIPGIQNISGIKIYPKDYFNPSDYVSKKNIITSNTRSIHYFAGSWITPRERFMHMVENVFGKRGVALIHNLKIFLTGK